MKVTEAVKALRLHLGDTQQDLAVRLGITVTTAARYETTRPPSGRALARFLDLAREKGRHDIAAVFHKALAEEMGGVPVPRIFGGPGFPEISPRTNEEAQRAAALFDAMRDAAGKAEIEKFDKLFKARLKKFWNIRLELDNQ